MAEELEEFFSEEEWLSVWLGSYKCEKCKTVLFQIDSVIMANLRRDRLRQLLDAYHRMPKRCPKCKRSTRNVRDFISGQIEAWEKPWEEP